MHAMQRCKVAGQTDASRRCLDRLKVLCKITLSLRETGKEESEKLIELFFLNRALFVRFVN